MLKSFSSASSFAIFVLFYEEQKMSPFNILLQHTFIQHWMAALSFTPTAIHPECGDENRRDHKYVMRSISPNWEGIET